MSWHSDGWIEKTVPKDATFSRDFVKYLMQQAWEEGKKEARDIQAAQDREDKYGPDI